MRISTAFVALVLSTTLSVVSAHAQMSDGVVKIGIMNDQAGPYSSVQGHGSVVAAQLAIDDFGGKVKGVPIALVVGDHANKSDVGVAMARRWMDVENVDMIADFGNSSVSLAVQEATRDKRVTMHVGSGSDALFGDKCSSTGFLWVYDSTAIAQGLGKGIVQNGGDTWFFIAVDYAFGLVMERELASIVTKNGGKVLGTVRHPLSTMDFASYLLQAQASGAKTIALLNAGNDTTNAIKQAAEFGIVQGGQKLAGTTFYILTVDALGLQIAQGLQVVTAYYWDQNEETRRFAMRWKQRMQSDVVPTQIQAGVYSAVHAYLKAVEAAGTDDSRVVASKIRELPVNDFFAEGARVRKDGRLMKDMFLVKVKSPAESKQRWDYYTVEKRLAAADIIRPLEKGGCKYAMEMP